MRIRSSVRYFSTELLSGRTAVVTGGGGGVGLAIAAALIEAGADVLIAGRTSERLATAERILAERTGRLCASLPCDVRVPDDVRRLHEFAGDRFGPVSIVVNNAAANFLMPARRMTERAIRTVVDTDLMGTFNVTREFLPDLVATGRGAVVSIGIAGIERGFPGYAHAAAAKAAILALTCSWAHEWGRYGVRVNSVSPGPIPTPGVTVHMLSRAETEVDDAFTDVREKVPLGRLGMPEDVAGAVVFLCSDAASWITGVNLTIDGGLTLNLGARPDLLD